METREWKTIKEYQDILFDFYNGIAKITINRPRYRNAFTPTTTSEISDALYYCRECQDINVVVLTGAGDKAFCSGGDMHVKGHGGYIGTDGVPRLNVLDVQKQIRSLPKPVIAMVNGYAIGGGHVLHVVCDLTIASDNAIFGQTGPKVGSFDAGFGSSYLARIVGQKKVYFSSGVSSKNMVTVNNTPSAMQTETSNRLINFALGSVSLCRLLRKYSLKNRYNAGAEALANRKSSGI